jgi:hypothetical protein
MSTSYRTVSTILQVAEPANDRVKIAFNMLT